MKMAFPSFDFSVPGCLLLASLVLVLFCSSSQPCFAAKCNADDEAGLLAFKAGITQDPSGMLSSWKPGTDCCTWSGVVCRVEQRVTALTVFGQADDPKSYLSGTISPSLSKVQNLDGIYLQNLRNITGPFPKFLYSLPKLALVYIENLKLSGPLPVDIGQRLNPRILGALSLRGNRFSGTIPSSVSQLTQLTQLLLANNVIGGTLPDGLQKLNKLSYLDLSNNQLSGKIPDFFTSFPDLRILELSSNKFTGKIPPSIASLASKLTYLELGHNSLNDTIPEYLGRFFNLDTLNLSSNHLTGTVPKSFKNLTKIFNLDLSNNNLVDPFPEMNVKGIESLHLSHNKFNLGQIPKWVTTSPIIYSLKLAGCGIKQRLDNWKPTETRFYDYIDLSDNQITGSPVGLLNRTDLLLVGFWMSGNKLQFNMSDMKVIPKTMKYLDLSRNQIFGKIPEIVAKVEKLNVSHNHLCGQIPATKAPATAFLGNDCLCGSPLPACKS